MNKFTETNLQKNIIETILQKQINRNKVTKTY